MLLKSPIVSVCIPVFNCADYIGQAINSVLNQTFSDFELVIIDNASTDDTVKVISKFNDKRLKIIKNDKNIGAKGNWNLCLKQARGEFIKILPADDLLVETCLMDQVGIFLKNEKRDLAIVFGGRNIINQNGKKVLKILHKHVGKIESNTLVNLNLLSGTNIIGPPGCVMLRRDICQKVGGFSDAYPFVIDLDYWFKVLKHGSAFSQGIVVSSFRISSLSWTVSLGHNQSKSYSEFIDFIKQDPFYKISFTTWLISKTKCQVNMLLRLCISKYILVASRWSKS